MDTSALVTTSREKKAMDAPHGIRRAALSLVPLVALLLAATGIQQARAGIVMDTTFTFSGCERDTCIDSLCFVVEDHIVVRAEGANRCGVHINLHGTGTGPHGEQYVISATQNWQLDTACSGGCEDIVANAHIIGHGQTPGLLYHVIYTFCCCPPTVTIKNSHIECH